jgi:glucosamine kinase
MLIIVDSGSTKSDWQIIHSDGRKELISTKGFNPFFHDEDHVETELKKDFVQKVQVDEVTEIHFYGAGCSDKMRCDVIKRGLERIFKHAEITVDHDLLASARAACGDKAGIACIIGTGSNTCLYDGAQITDNVTNMGYLLGDEGSGSHLGKSLLRSYFYREMPDDIKAAFEAEYGTDKRGFLNHIYGESPNVYLSSFATFFSKNRENLYIQKLVGDAFEELVERHILKYDGCHHLPVCFVGSIAFHFQDILKMTLEEHGLDLGNVIRKPIDSLTEYHLKNRN